MEDSPGQHKDERAVPITYRAEIFAQRGGEEVRLGAGVRRSSIRELAEDLAAQASKLESEAKEKLDGADGARVSVQSAPAAVAVLGSEAVAVQRSARMSLEARGQPRNNCARLYDASAAAKRAEDNGEPTN